jgi:hypothetical protein
VSNARPFLEARAVVRALACREECFPGDAGRVIDPGFFGLGVAAGRLALFDHVLAGTAKPRIDIVQFILALDLDAEMIETGTAAARRDRKKN